MSVIHVAATGDIHDEICFLQGNCATMIGLFLDISRANMSTVPSAVVIVRPIVIVMTTIVLGTLTKMITVVMMREKIFVVVLRTITVVLAILIAIIIIVLMIRNTMTVRRRILIALVIRVITLLLGTVVLGIIVMIGEVVITVMVRTIKRKVVSDMCHASLSCLHAGTTCVNAKPSPYRQPLVFVIQFSFRHFIFPNCVTDTRSMLCDPYTQSTLCDPWSYVKLWLVMQFR